MEYYSFIIDEQDAGIRLDKVLTQKFPEKTRNFLQKLFREERIFVNGKAVKTSSKPEIGQKVEVFIPAPKPLDLQPADIPLDIVFENKDLLVLNKPPGLVVHPGQGESHQEDSLVNAILHHCKGELSGISGVMRPGIVHRLDKDTSGLLIVAKNDKAHQDLAQQLKDRTIEKVYTAVVAGELKPAKGSIEAPIGRSSHDRKKMAVVQEGHGKAALTHYEVVKYFHIKNEEQPTYSLVQIQLITGRTHQIRVHFASIGHPLIGDQMYGRSKLNKFFERKIGFGRQFLHATKLSFRLPGSQKKVSFEAPLPEDLQEVLKFLQKG